MKTTKLKVKTRQLKAPRRIVGVDEAGRGPLAGPVAIGGCCYNSDDRMLHKELRRLFPVVKDSKQLSHTKREAVYKELTRLSKCTTLRFEVVLVSSMVIDTRGISHAIKKGLERVLKRLVDDAGSVEVLLDGGLRAPAFYYRQSTHIRGDATHLPIALASIAAKVVRDRHMIRLAKRFPNYAFEIHKGYGTKSHYVAIKKNGLTKIHRKTFVL